MVRCFQILLGIVCLFILPLTTPAATPVMFVRPDGLGWPCGTSPANACESLMVAFQHAAILEATTIRVAEGEYTEHLDISNTVAPASGTGELTIEGGWNAAFTFHHQDHSATVVTSPEGSPVFFITSNNERIALRLTDLTLKLEYPTGQQLVRINNYFNGQIELAMENCRLVSPDEYDPSTPAILVSNDGLSEISLNLNRCIVAETNRGGLALYGSVKATVTNSVFAKNATNTGVISVRTLGENAASLTMINDTILGNTTEFSAGGINLTANNESTLHVSLINTIVHGNGTDLYVIRNNPSAQLTISARNSILGTVVDPEGLLTDQGGNLDSDPLLDARYRLMAGSPAIDAGICGRYLAYPTRLYLRTAPYDDFEGQTRPGFGETSGCDIGADEFHPFPWSLILPALLR